MQLTIVEEPEMAEQARGLIARVEREERDIEARREIIELVTTIAVYRFAELSREEVEAMLGLRLQETRVYQEAKAEGREEVLAATISLLLKAGLTVEQIAQQTGVEVAVIQRLAQQQPS
jgi:predicted transposase YdaD